MELRLPESPVLRLPEPGWQLVQAKGQAMTEKSIGKKQDWLSVQWTF
ncbi:MAG TPA: hypothetical protein VN670_08725 [Acidobacteriaceae bacterium]|nr:hypothetical protein [Acidobacteriaceae bacterium]